MLHRPSVPGNFMAQNPWEFDSDFCNEKIGRPPRRQPRKKIEGETQMKLKSSRGIVMKLICCMALVVMSSVFASSQRAASLSIPTSGAMLTISGTVGSNSVNRNIYDSQLHTTT